MKVAGQYDLTSTPYLYNPNIFNTSAGDCVAACPNDTKTFLGRCVPYSNSTAFQEILSGPLSSWTNILSRGVSDIVTTWWIILLLCIASMILAFFWICLLRCCARFLVSLSILGVIAILGAVTAYVIYLAVITYRAAEDDPAHNSKVDAYIMIGIAVALGIVDLIALIIIIVMISRICLACDLVQETSRAIGSMFLIVFLPLWMALAIAICAGVWLVAVLFLLSAGVYTNNTGNRGYYLNWGMRYVVIYCVFFFFWILWFIRGMNQFTIAGALSHWYFTRQKPKPHPVAKAFGWGVRYHMGSIAFGAALIAIICTIRAILAYIQAKLKGSENRVAQFILCCLQCCLYCFQKLLEFISKRAYIMIAIECKIGFCRGAKEALKLIIRNILRMVAVDSVGEFLVWMGKLTITGAAVFVGLLAIRPGWFSKALEALLPTISVSYWWLPIAVIGLVSFLTSALFLSVYGFGIETLLMCFCYDSEVSKGREPFGPKSLLSYMEKVKKEELNRRLRQIPEIVDPDLPPDQQFVVMQGGQPVPIQPGRLPASQVMPGAPPMGGPMGGIPMVNMGGSPQPMMVPQNSYQYGETFPRQ